MPRTSLTLPFEGHLLRSARERRGWTQEDLAKRCSELGTNVSRFQVVRAETGRNMPTRQTLEAFAQALEIDVDDLLRSETLTNLERDRFAELELRIASTTTPGRVIQFLAEIGDRELYRDRYRTFGDYCRERWEIAAPDLEHPPSRRSA